MNDTLQIAAPAGATLQSSVANHGGITEIFDRYADGIIRGNTHLYDALEVHGVRNYAVAGDDGTHYEIDNINPTSFSVYVHIIDCGLECVGDFGRYADAEQYGTQLSAQYTWPLRNFVLEKHRTTTLAPLQ
jgi:hypothetical protein